MSSITIHIIPVLLGALVLGFGLGYVLRRRHTHTKLEPRSRVQEDSPFESGEFCRLLLENSPDAFVIVDDSLTILMVNDAYCRMTGRSKEEVIGKRPPFPGWPHDKWALLETPLQEMLAGRIKPFETDMYTKNGDRFPALFSVSHVRASDGKAYHFIIIKDITDYKKTELALRESEAKFKAQYMGIPIPVFIWQKQDDDFVLVDWNLAAERMTEGTLSSFAGVKASDMLRDDPDIRADLLKCFVEQLSFHRDLLYRFKLSQKTLYMSVTYAFFPPDFVLTHTEDLTPRMETEQKLKESEARFRTAIESLPFDFFMIDQDGRYIMMNSVARNNWGGNPIGRRPEELAPDEETAAIWLDNNRRAFSGEIVSGEVSFKIMGEERFLYNIISPVYDGDIIRGILGVNIDITPQKRAEQALRALAKRLHQVREEESAKIARDIHDQLGQSLTGLKFDLSRFGKQLSDAPSGAKPEFEKKIRSMTQAVDATIQSVREISAKLRPLILDDLGLTGAIEWQVQEFRKRTGIPCELNQNRIEEQEVRLDSQRSTAIFRILQEILTNVGRHAEAKHVWINVRNEADEFLLEVKDDGKGFHKESLEKIKRLGILGMNERALAFGGTVSIHSDMGKGTRVRVAIPFDTER